jgi:hypothetical protein
MHREKHVGLTVKRRLLLQNFSQIEMCQQILVKYHSVIIYTFMMLWMMVSTQTCL